MHRVLGKAHSEDTHISNSLYINFTNKHNFSVAAEPDTR